MAQLWRKLCGTITTMFVLNFWHTRKKKLYVVGKNCIFFQEEVIFCGHVLRQGRRSPAPGKLLPIQMWELPGTVTEFRGFLGLTNYFSEYVEHYADTAALLMGKLQLNRKDGKKRF